MQQQQQELTPDQILKTKRAHDQMNNDHFLLLSSKLKEEYERIHAINNPRKTFEKFNFSNISIKSGGNYRTGTY